jgi:hypothetical protein
MALPYSPPDVIVTQQRLTVQATTALPSLVVCVIAPCVAIVTQEAAGTYFAGSAITLPLPDLPPGAIVNPSTLQVFLNAQSTGGTQLGLFQLNVPDDAQLDTNGISVDISADIALSYSLLSSANNQGPANTANNVYASGVPDGIIFSDDAIDFLSLGTTPGNTNVVITAPASIAGTYGIYELVGSGVDVNTVKLQLLADVETNTPVLIKSFSITSGGYPSVNGTNVIPGSATNATNGDVGLIAPGGTVYEIGTSDYPAAGGFNVPAATSNDQVVVTMPVSQPTGVYAAFLALVTAAQVNDFIRIAGDSTGAANADYKIVAINLVTPSITIQRVGQTGTGSIATTGGGSATMTLLRVLRGQAYYNNGAGDFVTMTIAGVETDFEVLSATPTAITLINTITGLVGATPVTVRRGIPYRNTVATFDLVQQLTSGFQGTILTSYEAARVDVSLNGPIEIGDETDIITNFGVIHPDNPIALMCNQVNNSGLTASGGSFLALAVNDNTLASHEAALETLQGYEVYYMVPATQEDAVLSLYRAHVNAMSQPNAKLERILFQTLPIVTFEQIIPVTGTDWPDDGVVSSGTPTILTSTSTDWSLVSPGDLINILASSAPNAAIVETHRISSVNVGSSQATCLDSFSVASQTTGLIFNITSYPYSKDQQANDWAAYSSAIADFRIFTIRPDVSQLTYTDTTGPSQVDKTIIVPSYYAAAAFAGLASSLQPWQPLTNTAIPGVQVPIHSNMYFSPSQLDVIAAGGNLILVQATNNAAPYAREAISTDMTSIITKTLSITSDVDFAAKFFRASYRPFIGNQNITQEYLTQLTGIGEAICNGLVNSGSMLTGTQIVSVVQDPDQADGVDIVVSLNPPYPCNHIFITLQF